MFFLCYSHLDTVASTKASSCFLSEEQYKATAPSAATSLCKNLSQATQMLMFQEVSLFFHIVSSQKRSEDTVQQPGPKGPDSPATNMAKKARCQHVVGFPKGVPVAACCAGCYTSWMHGGLQRARKVACLPCHVVQVLQTPAACVVPKPFWLLHVAPQVSLCKLK